jgi:hypothetical protein
MLGHPGFAVTPGGGERSRGCGVTSLCLLSPAGAQGSGRRSRESGLERRAEARHVCVLSPAKGV